MYEKAAKAATYEVSTLLKVENKLAESDYADRKGGPGDLKSRRSSITDRRDDTLISQRRKNDETDQMGYGGMRRMN